MSAPTIYRWDDSGAPDLNAIMPTNNDKARLWMHTVLKACLVDGYGNKAAAGWAMTHEEIAPDGCRFVLNNAANSGSLLYETGVFCGGASSSSYNTLWVCSAVPSMDAPIGAWSYLLDYESRNNSSRHAHKINSSDSYKWNSWCVIANENTAIILGYKTANEHSVDSSTRPSDSGLLYIGAGNSGSVGAIDNPQAGNFYLVGGGNDDYTRSIGSSIIGPTVTTNVGVTGLVREGFHSYSYRPFNSVTTSVLDIFQVRPLEYMQYGDSSPIATDSTAKHHLFSLVGFRVMDVIFSSISIMNAWMIERGYQYGVPFQMGASSYVLFKAERETCLLFCLDASEWGGV
ncbi:MAG: hypothetical protein JKY50_04955 [Oleispira sp.]|nr:hypothetical protein [Oleispira sp.]